MIIAERQSLLQQLLSQRGMSDMDTLAAELRVSPSTVRRDLESLEQQGLVKRTHGGVIWVGVNRRGFGLMRSISEWDISTLQNRQSPGSRSLVSAGQTVLIDGGTTTFYLAQELLGEPLQIVTNSLPIANLFLNDDNVELILTGGLMYPRYGVLLGPTAENVLSTIHTKTLFLSVAGVHNGSLYNQNLLLVQSERRMMEQAQEVVLLVDSSKFGQQALAQLGELSEVDKVVTDSGISDEQRKAIEGAGCQLIVATV